MSARQYRPVQDVNAEIHCNDRLIQSKQSEKLPPADGNPVN